MNSTTEQQRPRLAPEERESWISRFRSSGLSQGRFNEGLISIFKDILEIEHNFDDHGRINRIKQGIMETLVDINNIAKCGNEEKVLDAQ